MGQYTFKGVDRSNQLDYGHHTPKGIVNVIDDGYTLVIFTRDNDVSHELHEANELLTRARKVLTAPDIDTTFTTALWSIEVSNIVKRIKELGL